MTKSFSARRAAAALAAIFVLLVLAAPAQAQSFNPNNPLLRAYFLLHLGRNGPEAPGQDFVGFPSRWPLPGSASRIELQIPEIDVCTDGLGDGDCSTGSSLETVRIIQGNLIDAIERSAFQWNREIRDESVLGQDFFTGCDGTDCSDMPTYPPLTPTVSRIIASGDNAGNATTDNSSTMGGDHTFNPGNRTCVFPAWSVDGSGNFDEFIEITSVNPDGSANFVGVGSDPEDSADATQLCTHFVQHTELDLLGGDSTPDTFRMVRDVQGRIVFDIGDGRNRIHFEQLDFAGAIGGDVDPDATLAVTATTGFIGGGPVGSIAEADIIFNADMDLSDPGEDTYILWTTQGATASSNCDLLQEAINQEEALNPETSSPDVDDGATQLCYRGTLAAYTRPVEPVAAAPVFDIENVMTHEMGHFIGLDHPCREFELTNPDETDCRNASESLTFGTQTRYSIATMFWAAHIGQTKSRTVETSDIAGLRALFALNVNAIFPVSTGSGGICTLSPGSSGWGPATWAVVLLPALLLLRRKRAAVKARKGRNLLAALLALGALGLAADAKATTVVIQSTTELAGKSSEIVHVKVTSAESVQRPDGWISTEYTLSPVDEIKGKGDFKLSLPGGQIGNRVKHISGTPSLQVGREYIIFAKPAGNGRMIVSGFSQGVKPVATDEETGIRFVRTGAAIPGSLHTTDEHGHERKETAVGAPELPELMQLEDYKDYLRSVVGK